MSELITLAETDTTFDKQHLSPAIMSNSCNYTKWLSFLAAEGSRLYTLTQDLDKEYSRLYIYYRFDFEWDISNRDDIKVMIKGNKEYQAKAAVVEQCRTKVNFIEGTLRAITNMGFNIGHFIKYEDLKGGFA